MLIIGTLATLFVCGVALGAVCTVVDFVQDRNEGLVGRKAGASSEASQGGIRPSAKLVGPQ